MNKSFKNVVAVYIHTCNLKNIKNKINERDICINASNFGVQNSAITLIALIITIIVLLILAGVTLNMVMGESGIFGKANNASEQTKISNAKEIIRMQVLENELNKKTKDSNAKMNEVEKKVAQSAATFLASQMEI